MQQVPSDIQEALNADRGDSTVDDATRNAMMGAVFGEDTPAPPIQRPRNVIPEAKELREKKTEQAEESPAPVNEDLNPDYDIDIVDILESAEEVAEEERELNEGTYDHINEGLDMSIIGKLI